MAKNGAGCSSLPSPLFARSPQGKGRKRHAERAKPQRGAAPAILATASALPTMTFLPTRCSPCGRTSSLTTTPKPPPPKKREGNRNRIRLWNEAIHQAFPYAPDHDGARTFWRVFHLHELRNRVPHMDSLLNTNVHDRTNEAFDLVESINPQVREWLSGTSTVRSVLRKRPDIEERPASAFV